MFGIIALFALFLLPVIIKVNAVINYREPSFYGALFSMGSEEDMKQAIIDGEVSEFVNSIDEAVDDFLK